MLSISVIILFLVRQLYWLLVSDGLHNLRHGELHCCWTAESRTEEKRMLKQKGKELNDFNVTRALVVACNIIHEFDQRGKNRSHSATVAVCWTVGPSIKLYACVPTIDVKKARFENIRNYTAFLVDGVELLYLHTAIVYLCANGVRVGKGVFSIYFVFDSVAFYLERKIVRIVLIMYRHGFRVAYAAIMLYDWSIFVNMDGYFWVNG